MAGLGLHHMTAKEINASLNANVRARFVNVLLTSGAVYQLPRASCSPTTNGLSVSGITSTGLVTIAITSISVAGIARSEMYVARKPAIDRRLSQQMFLDLLAAVESSDDLEFEISRMPAAFAFDPTEPPQTGMIMGGRNVLLYADVPWFELAHREGKSVSFGLSLFGFGGDAGFSWSKSLLDEIKKVAERKKAKTESLAGLCEREIDEVCLVDYLHLWRLDRVPPDKQSDYLKHGEEGRTWRPAFVTRSPNSPDPSNAAPHAVAYLATTGFWIGPEAWQLQPFPCRIFGSQVPQPISTTLGRNACHLRIRAVAMLARDQQIGFSPS
jgi:hypothetical protein